MNKKLVLFSFITVIGLGVATFFSLKVFEKYYFNETYYKVPNLKSLNLEEAEELLTSNDLNIRNMGDQFSELPVGEIFMQEPEAGSIVKKNRNIKVWVSKGEALVEVPQLVGMNFLDAKAIAEQKGLVVDRVASTKAVMAYNEVIATDPNTDTLLKKGQKISFLINSSEQMMETKMPDIIGINLDEANDLLEESSLLLGKINYVSLAEIPDGVIIETSLVSGRKVPAGTAIDVTVNKVQE
ncbi:MAG: PASTA domain-containing protein [Fusobacterium sp.]|nr:PASTA domain-containing protein [Fusobacterium sp.]